MAEGKKSFIVYADWKKYIDELSDIQVGQWFRWMFEYCNDKWQDKEIEYPNDVSVKMLCMMTKDTLKRDLKKYEAKLQRIEIINQRKREKEEATSKQTRNEIVNNIDNEIVNEVEVCNMLNDKCNMLNVLDKSNINKVSKDTMSSKLNDMCVEIIDYLNFKTGKSFKASSKANKTLIKARLDDGYTIDEFKKLIDNKCYQWLGTEQEQYLRPETLFRPSHFESYLNEVVKSGVKNNPIDEPNGGFRMLNDLPSEHTSDKDLDF